MRIFVRFFEMVFKVFLKLFDIYRKSKNDNQKRDFSKKKYERRKKSAIRIGL